MADKKATFILFAYDDGSSEYAVGEHAQEVMLWLNACQSMQFIHGGHYIGRKMIEVPAAPSVSELESIASIAKRAFPEEVAELTHSREGQES